VWKCHRSSCQQTLLLLQMEKNTAAGRTPSSLPISTPPPSALNVSSPDLQPLSPVHTNSLNDAKPLHVKPETTNFHLPPSYAEDNRAVSAFLSRGLVSENSLGDQRNEKLIGGGKFTNSLSLSLSHTHTHTHTQALYFWLFLLMEPIVLTLQ
jgi:hypothetical protein